MSWSPGCLEDYLIPVYYFRAIVHEPLDIPLGEHPVQGSVVVDCESPFEEDPLEGFGIAGFGVPGENSCPDGPVFGACCFEGQCEMLTLAQCEALHGDWDGSSTCDPNPCPQPGSCCLGSDCLMLLEDDCAAIGGEWLGFESCSPNPCNLGSCCLGEMVEECAMLSEWACEQEGGLWFGTGSCEPNPCVGACCVGEANNECVLVSKSHCFDLDGEWNGSENCLAACPRPFAAAIIMAAGPESQPAPVGACCTGGDCLLLSEKDCGKIEGAGWHGGVRCADRPGLCGKARSTTRSITWGQLKSLYR
jgi:hypothetical protein